MKLLRLRLKNINSIRDEVSLDFENGPLSETSLFAITGPTGSGKSTLLDALAVALFHKTPRLDGSASKKADNLLSQGAKEGFAEVLFEVNNKKYLAEWRVKRSKSNNLSSSVKLIETGSNALLNDKKPNNPIPEILGLNFDAFRRSVLLAQGEFTAFLKADAKAKRKLLESTTGLGVYDELLKVLNDKRAEVKNEFEKLQTALEILPKSDADEIKSTEKQMLDEQAQLAEIQEKQKKIKAERERETRRFNNWTQLKKTEAQRNELQEKSEAMTQLEQEIGQAQQAGELAPLQNTFEIEKKNQAEVEQAAQVAQEKLRNGQTELQSLEAGFNQKKTDFQQIKAGSVRQFEMINLAVQEEVKVTGLLAEAEHRKNSLAELQKEAAETGKFLHEKQAEKTRFENKLTTTQQDLAKIFVPADYPRVMADLNQKVANWRSVAEKMTELKQEGQRKKSEQEKYGLKSQKLDQEIQQQLAQKTARTQQKEQAEKDLNLILQQGTETELEKRRQATLALQEVALNYENVQQRQADFDKQKQQLESQKMKAETDRSQIKISKEKSGMSLALLKKKHARLEAEAKGQALALSILELRKTQLCENEPCPVCGATTHPWAERMDLAGEQTGQKIREQIEAAKAELDHEQVAFQKFEQKESVLAATLLQFKERIDEIDGKTNALTAKVQGCQQEWVAVFADQVISSQFIKDEIRFCDTRLQEIRSRLGAIKELEKEIIHLEPKISTLRSELKHARQQLEVLSGELEKKRVQYRDYLDRKKKLEDSIRSQLPPEQHEEDVAAAVSKLGANIEQQDQMKKDIAQLNQEVGQLATFIQENEKREQQFLKQCQLLEREIAQYQKEAAELEAQIKEKTGGVSAGEARQKLEQKLQSLEEELGHAQKIVQDKSRAVTGFETGWKALRQRLEECKEKYENAVKEYTAAVKAAGFQTIAAHQKALRAPDWLHAQRQILDSFQKNFFSVEQEIKRLSSEFKDGEFQTEILEALQTQETELEKMIQTLNTQIGTLKQKLEQQKNNLSRYQQLEAEVAKANAEYERWQKLYDLIGKNKLSDYALKSMFNLLIRYANHQMSKLTARYILKVKDMKDMVVVDTWNAGEERPVETLSGGESFLTSLALALALSELSKGRAELRSLFLDEGFGSLDSDTLELALDALENLRLSGRRVGIISHVQELTQRIPVRIAIKKKGDGSSVVAIEGTI